MTNSTSNNNTLNLMAGAFLTADDGVEISPLNAPIAVRLMCATGSKLVDKQLMTVGSEQYYVSQLPVVVDGEIIWVMVPVTYSDIKWSNNIAYALLRPEAMVLTEDEFNSL